MDTLSSSFSSFKLPTLHSTSGEFPLFKFSHTPHHHHLLLPLHPHPSFSTTKPNSISNRSTPSSTHNTSITPPPPPFLSPSQITLSPTQSPLTTHRKASTGYAAALLDVARSNNTIEAVGRDVRRFAKWLSNKQIRGILKDPFVEERDKGELVVEVAEGGKFHRHLVALVKMLVDRRKLGLVGEVLGEFEAIYDQLCGTPRIR